MVEPRPSRRTVLKGATGTGAAALFPAPAAPLEADPLLALVIAFRIEKLRLDTIAGDIPDDEPTPALDAINAAAGLPPATTKEGATAALQLALEMHRARILSNAQPNLIEAALRFLERPSTVP
ncbi:twin-arginine translocation signal domain-containing protein [Xanthobacter oligotrophicus]|uniref:twin-arginine translocation signal domain-containing protein n=1 Tax=Xanthobacter oligotrophicus TaxID=2607286 RepID=UPI0011F0A101|nr:twin-arginine translocation signal domain-containing protein [Xanthobacter oligotrophicus]MCG5234326.1 twin-arginine translocation signal domain-containing protein [Xanthobacter oligotrophicus]